MQNDVPMQGQELPATATATARAKEGAVAPGKTAQKGNDCGRAQREERGERRKFSSDVASVQMGLKTHSFMSQGAELQRAALYHIDDKRYSTPCHQPQGRTPRSALGQLVVL